MHAPKTSFSWFFPFYFSYIGCYTSFVVKICFSKWILFRVSLDEVRYLLGIYLFEKKVRTLTLNNSKMTKKKMYNDKSLFLGGPDL